MQTSWVLQAVPFHGPQSALADLARAAALHPDAAASACCCDLLNLNNFSRLSVAAIRCHSPFTFSSLRNNKRHGPRASLICPFTGSTIALRWA